MEAPEKIMIGKSNITSDGNAVFAWLTTESDCEAMQHNIEYIRTDVFLKKACKWLKNNSEKYVVCYEDGYCYYAYNSMIDDFKNYIQKER